jgi:prepilin-type N-terminal cleavage/methylation domain-containing protein
MQHRSPRRQPIAPALHHASRPPRGFTLIELLVVIAIISVLAALLFPVFASARGKAREISCVSNLRQAGLAISMYAQDYDGLYPYGVDPADRDTPQIWNAFPDFKASIPSIPWLHAILQPYVKSRELFHCPSDTGIVIEDFTGLELDALPTSYGKYGTSYLYRTEIAFRHLGDAAFQNPADVNVYMEGSGIWHGSGPGDRAIGVSNWYKTNPDLLKRRFNTLHGDGHVKSLLFRQLQAEWDSPL